MYEEIGSELGGNALRRIYYEVASRLEELRTLRDANGRPMIKSDNADLRRAIHALGSACESRRAAYREAFGEEPPKNTLFGSFIAYKFIDPLDGIVRRVVD